MFWKRKATILFLGILLSLPLWAGPPKLLTIRQKRSYQKMGKALAKIQGKKLKSVTSSSCVNNLMMVGMNLADYTIVQLDVLFHIKKEPKYQSLRGNLLVVTPLHLEEVHILVRRDKRILSLFDLYGRKIGVGHKSAGSYASATKIFRKVGISLNQISLDHSEPKVALSRLLSGHLDALILTEGQPLSLIRNLEEKEKKKISFLDLGQRTAERLAKKLPHYRASKILASSYSFLSSDIYTLAIPAVLVVRRKIEYDEVKELCTLIFNNFETLEKSHSKWADVSFVRAMTFLKQDVWPLHPGSRDYFLAKIHPKALRLVTAQKGGTYWKIGQDISRASSERGTPMIALPSRGSVHNILSTAQGQTQLALIQMDSLLFFQKSSSRKLTKPLRCLVPLYMEEMHILVRKGSGIRSLKDMKGKKINCGLPSSGTFVTASYLLSLYGLDTRHSIQRDYSSSTEALKNLVNGKIDGLFFMGGAPIDSLKNLSSQQANQIRFFPLKIADIPKKKRLRTIFPYREVKIAKGTYSWLKKDIPTLATPCLFVSSKDLATPQAKMILKSILDYAPKFSHPKWANFRFQKIQKNLKDFAIPIQLHPTTREIIPLERSRKEEED